MKRYIAIGAIAALGLAATGCGEDEATATKAGCNPGEWVTVKVVEQNGDTDTTSLRRSLPEGTSLEGGGVTIYSDGRVDAPPGATVECLKPTH